MAAGGDDPPLVEGQGAEVAGPKAAPIVRNGNSTSWIPGTPPSFHRRMVHTLIGQRVDPVKLLSGQGRHRRILYHNLVPVALNHGFSPHRVMLILLLAAGNGVIPFRGTYRSKLGHSTAGPG